MVLTLMPRGPTSLGQRLGEVRHRGLRGAVCHDHRVREGGIDRADVDDRARASVEQVRDPGILGSDDLLHRAARSSTTCPNSGGSPSGSRHDER
jgi:hypothetical protein